MFQFFCSILCPRSPEKKSESCGELENKVLLLVPQIVEGFWSCTSDAALLQDPLRFEVHQEIVHGHSFPLQWKTSEFSSAVLQLDSVVTVLVFMLESPRCNHQSKRTFLLRDVGHFHKVFLCLHERSTRSISERVDLVTVEWHFFIVRAVTCVCNRTVAPFLLNLFLAAHLHWKWWVSFVVSEIERQIVSMKPTVFVFHPLRLTLSAVVSMDDHLNIPPLGRGAPSSVCARRIRQSSCIAYGPINHATIFIEASRVRWTGRITSG